jgi:hypothetical protein
VQQHHHHQQRDLQQQVQQQQQQQQQQQPPTGKPAAAGKRGPPALGGGLKLAVGSCMETGDWKSNGVWVKKDRAAEQAVPSNLQVIPADDLVKVGVWVAAGTQEQARARSAARLYDERHSRTQPHSTHATHTCAHRSRSSGAAALAACGWPSGAAWRWRSRRCSTRPPRTQRQWTCSTKPRSSRACGTPASWPFMGL